MLYVHCLVLLVVSCTTFDRSHGNGHGELNCSTSNLQVKWTVWFQMNDVNNDGVHSEADAELFGNRIAASRHVSEAERKRIVDYLMWAREYPRTMTVDQYVASNTKSYTTYKNGFNTIMMHHITSLVHGIFLADSLITKDVFRVYVESLGMPHYMAVFHFLSGGTDTITKEHLIALMVDRLTNPCVTLQDVKDEEIILED